MYKKITDELAPLYWDGPSNVIARYYAYLQRGFGFVNEAKNYFLIFFGILWTNKVISFFGYTIGTQWIVLGGIIGIPCLVIVGRWQLFKAAKAVEFIGNRHGSVTGYNSYNMTIETLEVNKEQNAKLDKIIELLSKSDKIKTWPAKMQKR